MMGRYQVTLSSNTPHCAPLERGNLDMSHSINIAQDLLSPSLFVQLILWIEERDSDQKVLLAERIIPTGIMVRSQVTLTERNIPTGIMARYQVTLDIEDLYQDLLSPRDLYRAPYPVA